MEKRVWFLEKRMERELKTNALSQDYVTKLLQEGWTNEQVQLTQLNFQVRNYPSNRKIQIALRFFAVFGLTLWVSGLFLPGFVEIDGDHAFSGLECFIFGAFLFAIGPFFAWLLNIPFFLMLISSAFPNKQVWPHRYKQTALLMWIATLGAFTIFWYPRSLPFNENSSSPVTVGLGGYFWIASIGVFAIAYTCAWIISRKFSRQPQLQPDTQELASESSKTSANIAH